MLRALLLAGVCLAGWTGPVSARPFDDVAADGTLRVALYAENAPFSDLKDGKPQGIEVDLADAIARELKVKLDLRLVDAGENVDGDFRLNLWRGDLANSQLADLMLHVPIDRVLALRNEQIFMTRPYLDQHLAIGWRKEAVEGFESLQDIAGHAVAVQGNSAADAMMLTAEGGRFRNDLKHYVSFDAAAKAFVAGETAFIAGTRAEIEAALFTAKAAPDAFQVKEFKFAGPVKLSWEIGGAVRSDSRDLGYAVGEAITTLIANGTMNAIFDKYGVTFTPPKGY